MLKAGVASRMREGNPEAGFQYNEIKYFKD